MRVTFDGERVVDVEPVFGYLHRGSEKLAEERTYIQIVTLTDRLDYTAAMSNNLAYVRAVERLAGIEVPERGMYLRVIAAELQRIAAHLIFVGFFLQEMGAFGTPLMYSFRERERILDLFEMMCGGQDHPQLHEARRRLPRRPRGLLAGATHLPGRHAPLSGRVRAARPGKRGPVD